MFHLTRVNNTGAAFGWLQDHNTWLLLTTLLFLFFFLGYQAIHRKKTYGHLEQWVHALIAAGALGNVYDRFRYGYVIDFLDFQVWPVFNVADACICLGVAGWIYLAWSREPRKEPQS